jgi:hypothetical protein
MKTNLGNTCSNLFKYELFKGSIKWDESLKSSQEYNLMFEILKMGISLIFDSQINTIIRIRDFGSISKSNICGKWERYAELRVRIIKYLSINEPEILNDDLLQALFSSIRTLYPYNPNLASLYYNKNLSNNFVPRKSLVNSKSYVFAFKILGFYRVEKVKFILKKLNLQ